MKRSVLLIIAALVCASAYVLLDNSNDTSAELTDQEGVIGSTSVTYKFEASTKTLTFNGSGDMGNLAQNNCPWQSYMDSIESVVFEGALTTVGMGAFSGATSLTSVRFNDTVQTIGQNAFYNCTSLNSVTFGTAVTTIAFSAFQGCSSLTSMLLPTTVSSIGVYAFQDCSSLTSVELGSATSVGNSAFERCSSLTSVVIPDSVTTVGDMVFRDCTSLSTVTIGKAVTSLGSSVFEHCTALVSIKVNSENGTYTDADGVLFNKDKTTLIQYPACKTGNSYTVPSSVKSLGDAAFYGCVNLTTVNLGSAESMGSEMFTGCKALTTVNLGSVKEIKLRAFKDCTSLKTLDISSVNRIQSEAFYGCTSLTGVTLSKDISTIERKIFYGCTSITTIDLSQINMIQDDAFYGCTSLDTVTLGESLMDIGRYAFYDCTSLTKITIPKSVNSIGNYVFWNCASLTEIEVVEGNEKYSDIEGVLFENKTNLIKYPAAKDGSSYQLPENVTYVASDAFWDCTKLQSFTVAEGNSKFKEVGGVLCNDIDGKISLVAYPAGKTDSTYTIPAEITDASTYYAFCGSKNLTKVVLHDNITVGNTVSVALAYCPALENIEDSSNSRYKLVDGALYNKEGTNLVLCLSTKSGVFDVADGTETIAPYAFANACKITTLNFPDSVKQIDFCAFLDSGFGGFGCSSLCSITFGNGLTTIDSGAFSRIEFSADGKTLEGSADNLKGKTFAICKGTLETGFEHSDGGHILTAVDEVLSTDSTDGVKAHQKCSVCGQNLLNGKVASEADLKIPMGSGSGSSGDSGSSSGEGSGTTGDSGSISDSGSASDSGSSSGEGTGTTDGSGNTDGSGSSEGSGTTDGSGNTDGNGTTDGSGSSDENGISTSTAVTVAAGSVLAILVLAGAYLYYRKMM